MVPGYNYGYNYGYTTPNTYGSTLGMIGGGIVLGFLAIFCLYFILAWVFRSIGLYHLAKNRGIAHAWFAWVPILSQYILGRLINNKVVLGDDIVVGHASFFLPFLTFLTSSLVLDREETSWIFLILSAAVWVYSISALWRLFKIYRPKNRVSFTIWSIILTSGFFIFAIRDDKPFDELEPNKVYENYYGGKQVIDNQYAKERAGIRERERQEKEELRDNYQAQLSQENLTDQQKDQLRSEYYEDRQAIKEEADNLIKEENKEYQAEIETFSQDIKEHLDPTVSVTPNDDVVITSDLPQDNELNSVIELPQIEDVELETAPLDTAATVEVESVEIPESALQIEEDVLETSMDQRDEITETIDAIKSIVENQNIDE